MTKRTTIALEEHCYARRLISERMEQALGAKSRTSREFKRRTCSDRRRDQKARRGLCRKGDAQAFDLDQDAAIRGSLKGVEELKGNVHVSFNRADEPRGNDPGRNRGRISCDAESF